MTPRERFMRKVVVEVGEHWRWLGKAKNGRGWFRFGPGPHERREADRAAWMLFRGDVLPGHVVRYCSTPGCVNPWHARLQRTDEFVREFRPPVVRGEGAPTAKLDSKTVRRIVRLWNSGWTGKQIRGRIGGGVTVQAIQMIVSGRTWRHLDLNVSRPRRVRKWRVTRQVLTDLEVLVARHMRASGYSVREAWRRCGTKACEGATAQAIYGRTFRHLPLPAYPRAA